MKLAYFGTPQFAADFLDKILTDPDLRNDSIELVVTRPDKPVGRKQILTPSPVRLLAEQHKIVVSTDLPKALDDIDLALVYAYGKIIPADLLHQPAFGFWNIHPSLLPKYRGASPTTYPLLNGDTVTGVTLMQMDEKMDHGPIIAQEKYEINPADKRPDLERELTSVGFELFKRHLLSLNSNNSKPPMKDQDHAQATFTKLLKKEDGFIPLEEIRSALTENGTEVYNKFRAFYPWPGIWTRLEPRELDRASQRLKITDCTFKDNKLIIKKVQLEGKTEVAFQHTFLL